MASLYSFIRGQFTLFFFFIYLQSSNLAAHDNDRYSQIIGEGTLT